MKTKHYDEREQEELIESTVDKIEQHATIHDYTQVGHCVREAIQDTAAERDKLREQRDKLVAALRDIKNAAASPYQVAEVDRLLGCSNNLVKFSSRVYSVADAAIKKAEAQ